MTGKHYSNKFLVAIGGSAGSLAAFAQILSLLPVNAGIIYVVLMHISSDQESMLAPVLQQSTKMPVVQIEPGLALKSDCVYVNPPGNFVYVEKGCFILKKLTEHVQSVQLLDMFFASASAVFATRFIGVVLSGLGGGWHAGRRRGQREWRGCYCPGAGVLWI